MLGFLYIAAIQVGSRFYLPLFLLRNCLGQFVGGEGGDKGRLEVTNILLFIVCFLFKLHW